ncbi:hypothetical protein CYMTET_19763, partial [Cymbomonas tetramitiformis]
ASDHPAATASQEDSNDGTAGADLPFEGDGGRGSEANDGEFVCAPCADAYVDVVHGDSDDEQTEDEEDDDNLTSHDVESYSEGEDHECATRVCSQRLQKLKRDKSEINTLKNSKVQLRKYQKFLGFNVDGPNADGQPREDPLDDDMCKMQKVPVSSVTASSTGTPTPPPTPNGSDEYTILFPGLEVVTNFLEYLVSTK